MYLCPKPFLDDMGVSFSKGDEIALTGSKIKQGEADLSVARDVARAATRSSSATINGTLSGLAPLSAISRFGRQKSDVERGE